jgi:hypothetical protein
MITQSHDSLAHIVSYGRRRSEKWEYIPVGRLDRPAISTALGECRHLHERRLRASSFLGQKAMANAMKSLTREQRLYDGRRLIAISSNVGVEPNRNICAGSCFLQPARSDAHVPLRLHQESRLFIVAIRLNSILMT